MLKSCDLIITCWSLVHVQLDSQPPCNPSPSPKPKMSSLILLLVIPIGKLILKLVYPSLRLLLSNRSYKENLMGGCPRKLTPQDGASWFNLTIFDLKVAQQ